MESLIISSILKERRAYETYERIGDVREFSALGSAVYRVASEYYGADPTAQSCPIEFVEARMLRDVTNAKYVGAIKSYLAELPRDVSVANIEAEARALHRQRVAAKLSLALANGKPAAEIERLISEYQSEAPALKDEPENTGELIDVLDCKDLIEPQETDKREFIRLWPRALDESVQGRTRPGHHVLIFARPETGKTAFTINLVAGFLKQRLDVLYVGNEEPAADIRDRIRGRILRVDRGSLRPEDGTRLHELLSSGAIGSAHVVGGGSTFASVRGALAEADGRYSVVVFDQIRGMRVKADSRTNELEAAATEARAIARECNVLVVSVTQAGAEAEGRVYLRMGDVDSSKTGIPGAVDLMVGLGADDVLRANNMLGVSLCKNKMTGNHAQFTVKVNFATGVIE